MMYQPSFVSNWKVAKSDMQDIETLSNFLTAAGKKFQTHPSDIAQEIYPSLVSDLIPRQSPVFEAAPVDISLSSFLQHGKSDLISPFVTMFRFTVMEGGRLWKVTRRVF